MVYFNNRIRNARIEKKLTQKQLAEQLSSLGHKTSNTAIANWESGLNKPDIDTLEAICKILNKDGNYFLNTTNNSSSCFDENTNQLLNYYNKLNKIGKRKAIENVKDLTEISKYICEEKKTDIQKA